MKNELTIKEEYNFDLAAERLENVSFNTKRTYLYVMNTFKKFCKTNNLEINIDSMERWLLSVEEPASRSLYVKACKKILTLLFKKNPHFYQIIERLSNIKKIKVDKSIKESEYLKVFEVHALAYYAPAKLNLIIMALFWTGCRVSELINIKLNNCNENDEFVSIKIIGKGSKERTVYMNIYLFNAINIIFEGKTYLFENKFNKKYTRQYVSQNIKKLGRKQLNKKISAHTLRHSKAMFLKDNLELSPDQIQKALGHSNVSTTLTHYFHGTPTAEDQGILSTNCLDF